MPFSFENLRVARLIVHETGLATSLDGNRPPKLSTSLTLLDQEGLDLLGQRLVDALGNESHSVEMSVDDDALGSVFNLCTTLIGSDSETFVTISQDLAMKLTRAQTVGAVKAGIAVIIDGTVGVNDTRFVAVMKAETDAGFAKVSGDEGVMLRYLDDLVLGAQQRLYKIGFFVEKQLFNGISAQLREKTDFFAFVYDHLMSQNVSRDAAIYFYKTFLGCAISETDKTLTRDFYHKTTDFINNLNLSNEDKVDIKNSLNAYLNSQKTQVSVGDFATDFFDPHVRGEYVKAMSDQGFPPRNFSKDISLIKSKLRQRRIKFSSKVRIVGPSEDFSTLVKVIGKQDDWTVVHISGDIEDQP